MLANPGKFFLSGGRSDQAPRPSDRDADIDLASGRKTQALDDGDEGRSSAGERWHQDAPSDDPGELDAR